jgi:hypothetical protein
LIVTAEALRSNAPHSATLHDYGGHYLLGATAGDQAFLFQQVDAAEPTGRVT